MMLTLPRMRVLLVAGDDFTEPIVAELRRESVEAVVGSSHDLERAWSFDVVVVELPLADWDGMRKSGASVIAFADRADLDTVTRALTAGADDVITRRDRPHEAVARIRAIARRRPAAPRAGPILRVGGVELDPGRRTVLVDRQLVELTRKQFELLQFLLENAGRVVSRGSLLENVWGIASRQQENAVEVQVRRLREAIETDPRAPARLRTVRGVGYIYERV